MLVFKIPNQNNFKINSIDEVVNGFRDLLLMKVLALL